MNSAVTEPRAWSPARRSLLIMLVFAAHVGLILALGNRNPVRPRPPAPAPSLSLAPDSSELLELNDPTLFALPHRQGFAGAAWLKIPTVQFPPFRWTEPPRLLPLPIADLGVTFAQFMRTNVFVSRQFETKPAPDLPLPVAQEFAVAPTTNSTLRVAGDLVNRRLLNPPQLQPWPALDLLTNTVVQVLVNAEGNVVSPTLLTVSGSKPADQSALDIARAARFEPLRRSSPALTVGALIFEWHTEPLTNAPAANP
jgi:TonB family protein